MVKTISSDAIDGRGAIQNWRSNETEKVRREVAKTSQMLRNELELELHKLGRLSAFRSDAALFRDWLLRTGKPDFDALAERLLTEAGRDLTATFEAPDPTEEAGAKGRVAAVLRRFSDAPTVALPVVGIGVGLYLVFAVAITTASSFVVLRKTEVGSMALSIGLAVVALSASLLFAAPSHLLRRKRAQILERYDAYVAREIAQADISASPDTLESRLIAAIRRRATDLETALGDE